MKRYKSSHKSGFSKYYIHIQISAEQKSYIDNRNISLGYTIFPAIDVKLFSKCANFDRNSIENQFLMICIFKIFACGAHFTLNTMHFDKYFRKSYIHEKQENKHWWDSTRLVDYSSFTRDSFPKIIISSAVSGCLSLPYPPH